MVNEATHSPLAIIHLPSYLSLLKNGSHEPPTLLLVIPSAAEGSRRRGLASPSGRDSSAPLGMTGWVIVMVLKRFQQNDRELDLALINLTQGLAICLTPHPPVRVSLDSD